MTAMNTPEHFKRPNAEIGSYLYWRLEVREFFLLCETGTDLEQLGTAFGALFVLASKTVPDDHLEKVQVDAEWNACISRYERARNAFLNALDEKAAST